MVEGAFHYLQQAFTAMSFDLSAYGITVTNVLRNLPVPALYEQAILRKEGEIVSSGALATLSGEKTGRSPKDKRVVDHPDSTNNIWWGDINIPLSEQTYTINRQRAIDYLNTRDGERPFFLFLSYIEPHHQNDHGHFEGPEGSKERWKDYEVPGDLEGTGGDWKREMPDYLGCCNSLDTARGCCAVSD